MGPTTSREMPGPSTELELQSLHKPRSSSSSSSNNNNSAGADKVDDWSETTVIFSTKIVDAPWTSVSLHRSL